MSRFGTLNTCWQRLRQHEFPLKDGALPKGMIKVSKLSNDLTLEHLNFKINFFVLSHSLSADSSCSAAVVKLVVGSKEVKILDSEDVDR